MTTYNIESVAVANAATTTSAPTASVHEKYLSDLNARADRLLRLGNGIRDEIVFPRLREMGVAETDLHRVAMRMVRRVQWTRDFDGPTAKLLGVVRCGINGTAAAPEVV